MKQNENDVAIEQANHTHQLTPRRVFRPGNVPSESPTIDIDSFRGLIKKIDSTELQEYLIKVYSPDSSCFKENRGRNIPPKASVAHMRFNLPLAKANWFVLLDDSGKIFRLWQDTYWDNAIKIAASQGFIIIDSETNLPTQEFIEKWFPILDSYAKKLSLSNPSSSKDFQLFKAGIIWEAVLLEMLNRRDINLLPDWWTVMFATSDEDDRGIDFWLYWPQWEKVAVQFTTKDVESVDARVKHSDFRFEDSEVTHKCTLLIDANNLWVKVTNLPVWPSSDHKLVFDRLIAGWRFQLAIDTFIYEIQGVIKRLPDILSEVPYKTECTVVLCNVLRASIWETVWPKVENILTPENYPTMTTSPEPVWQQSETIVTKSLSDNKDIQWMMQEITDLQNEIKSVQNRIAISKKRMHEILGVHGKIRRIEEEWARELIENAISIFRSASIWKSIQQGIHERRLEIAKLVNESQKYDSEELSVLIPQEEAKLEALERLLWQKEQELRDICEATMNDLLALQAGIEEDIKDLGL